MGEAIVQITFHFPLESSPWPWFYQLWTLPLVLPFPFQRMKEKEQEYFLKAARLFTQVGMVRTPEGRRASS